MTSLDKITLGGGCFWCLEAMFNRLNGVSLVRSGYSGGTKENPTWAQVCSGETSHAEVCEIHFDSSIISLDSLLEVFWGIHDPTTLNKQGHDVGTQYRSVVFCENEMQMQIVLNSKTHANTNFRNNVVTEVKLRTNFYSAGEYHDSYYELNKNQPYCQFVVSPKLTKLFAQFPEYLKNEIKF
jgi:peptide-methionine (S)-S-oxide reductase